MVYKPSLDHRAEKRFNFDYYLNQPVKTDSNIKAKSFSAPRYLGLDDEIGSNYFDANFYSGGGWKLWQNQYKKYNLMVDNLWVRGTMTIWELIVNQLRAHNGTIILGSTGKTKEGGYELVSGTTYHLWFDSEDTDVDLQPFAVDDIIMAKRFKMNNDGTAPTVLYEVYGTVTAITVDGETNKITVDFAGSPNSPDDSSIPRVLEFVRIGNTTDASRQGLIVMTADGIDSGLSNATVPYIDVYNGIDSRSKFLDKDYVKVRLGRLDELTGNTDEFGAWMSVLHLVGGGGDIEGINKILWGTLVEMAAYDTNLLSEGDVWIAEDEDNNIYTWEDGVGWVDRTNEIIPDLISWSEEVATNNNVDFKEYIETYIKWHNEIVPQYTQMVAEATLFGVSSSAFTTEYNDLDTYLWTTLNLDSEFSGITNIRNFAQGVTINRTTWENHWQDFYEAWADLKEAIKTEAEDRIRTDGDGRYVKAAVPSAVPGFFGSDTHFGLHDGSYWGIYNQLSGGVASMHFAVANADMFQYATDTNKLKIGEAGLATTRMVFDGDTGEIDFWSYNYDGSSYHDDNVMTLDANIFGANTRSGGIEMHKYGLLYKNVTSYTGISTLHSVLSNQNGVGFMGGITSHVNSSTFDYISTGAFAYTRVFNGGKFEANYEGNTFTVNQPSLIAGVFGIARGNSSLPHVAFFGNANNSGAGATYLLYGYGDIKSKNGNLFLQDAGSTKYIGFTGTNYSINGCDLDMQANNIVDVGNVDGVSVSQLELYSSYGFSAVNSGTIIGSGNTTQITFSDASGVSFDDGSCFGSNKFTAPKTARYQLNVQVTFSSLPNNGSIDIQLITSTDTYKIFVDCNELFSANTGYMTYTLSHVVALDLNDTAEVKVYNNTGASIATNSGNTFFSGYIVGGI